MPILPSPRQQSIESETNVFPKMSWVDYQKGVKKSQTAFKCFYEEIYEGVESI